MERKGVEAAPGVGFDDELLHLLESHSVEIGALVNVAQIPSIDRGPVTAEILDVTAVLVTFPADAIGRGVLMPEENALVLLGPEPFEKLRRLLSGLRIDRTGSLGPNRVGEDDHEREDDEAVNHAGGDGS